ncbi:MAG TPA: glycosyltransferase family 9 protein [bacterium]|nr:glycosyltransferase family 9 protein [bacterium]
MNPTRHDSPRKILVIRLRAIGDIVLSTPVLRALRKAFPAAQIHFATYAVNEPLLRHNPNLNRLMVNPANHSSSLEKFRFFRAIRRERYDWVFDLEATPRSAWLTLATGAPQRVGYAFRVRKWAFTQAVPKNQVRRFQADVCLSLIRHMGVPDDGLRTELFLGPEEKAWARDYFNRPELSRQGRRVGLNPTGAWTSKQWPVKRWRELVSLLNESLGIKPLLFWGPGSEGLVREITQGLEDRMIVIPQTTLLQAAAFISGLNLLIGSDGTPQHMAQALGIPSLTLFGPSWGNGWTLTGDPRYRYLQHFMDCGPCDRTLCPFPERPFDAPAFPPPGSAHYHRECMDRITPETVLGLAKQMLPHLD